MLFFVLELVVGHLASSIALVADSFHLLSDVFALLVAYYAMKVANERKFYGPDMTYGLQRAEVLGALINGVSLLALSFTILIEALQRFFEPKPVSNPWMVFGTGCAGLGVNLIGLFLFQGHAHAHHGHSHSHAAPRTTAEPIDIVKSPSPENTDDIMMIQSPSEREFEHPASMSIQIIRAAELIHESQTDLSRTPTPDLEAQSSHSHSHQEHAGHNHGTGCSHAESHHSHQDHGHTHGAHSHGEEGDMNMRGVFLHVLGDALGTIGVMISTLIIIYAEGDWKYYMDPAMSVLITLIIIYSTFPLVKSASFILAQGVPEGLHLDKLRLEILRLPGVLNLHEFHVWQLSDTKAVASVHVVVKESLATYMSIAASIKHTLHLYGIHNTTVQPEFMGEFDGDTTDYVPEDDTNDTACLLKCETECDAAACCPSPVIRPNSPEHQG